MQSKNSWCALLTLAAVLGAVPAWSAPENSPARISAYSAYVEKARADWAVPGVAVAVIQHDKVTMLRGFGVRTLGRSEPVDGDTIFPIASLSKGFTAATIATLVGEDKLTWDDRIVDLLPGFGLADPWVSGTVTLRDLLSHRVGWPAEVDHLPELGYELDTILKQLHAAPLPDGFRRAFTYTNVAYLIAGEAAARRVQLPWPQLVRARLLGPLGMQRTFATLAETRSQNNRASTHTDVGGAMHLMPTPDMDRAAPAAAMASSAADLTRWVRMLLGGGTIDGRQVISAAVFDELFAPQNNYPDGKSLAWLFPDTHFESYALGWVVKDYHGRKVAWNTGGLLGASCSIALIPEDKLGVVVLTNGPRTSFPEALVWRAVDTWLGSAEKDWSRLRLEKSLAGRARAAQEQKAQEATREPTAASAVAATTYVGTYTMPLLGKLVIATEKGQLRVRWGRLGGVLQPWRRDVFRLVWDDPTSGTTLGVFHNDTMGKPVRIEIAEVGAFVRRE